jgi:hypothetical protein
MKAKIIMTMLPLKLCKGNNKNSFFTSSGRLAIATFLYVMSLIFFVFAQSQLSLVFPFGLPILQNSGMSFFMGGTANAVGGDYIVMSRNPANLGFIDKTVFSSLYTFDFTQLSQSSNHDRFVNSVPRQVSLGIPIGKFGTIGLSYDTRTEAVTKFRISAQSFKFDTTAVSFQPGLVATGGIIGWQVGWGREFPKAFHLRAGAVYERVYFSYAETVLRTVSDIQRTVSSRDSTYKVLGGDGLRAGLLFPLKKFKLGLSAEYFFNSDLRENNSVYSTSSDTVDTRGYLQAVPIDRRDGIARVRIPPSLVAGVSYSVTSEWLAAVDVSSVLWNLYYSHQMLPNARSDMALSFSGGMQYTPVIALLSPKYWETIRYAAGFRYNQLPANESSEFAFSFGAGLPIGKGRGEFDVGAELGRRTCGKYSGYAENFIHIAIGVNGGRKWVKSSEGNY